MARQGDSTRSGARAAGLFPEPASGSGRDHGRRGADRWSALRLKPSDQCPGATGAFGSRPRATSAVAGSNSKGRSRISGLIARARSPSISALRPAGSPIAFSRMAQKRSTRSTSAMASWRGRSATIRGLLRWRKSNARNLSATQIPEPIEICVIDVSFISLTLILPNALELLTPDGVILALIKPQFELAREDVEPGRYRARARAAREGAAKDRQVSPRVWAPWLWASFLLSSPARTATRSFSYVSENIGIIAHTGKPGAAELVRAVDAGICRRRLPVKWKRKRQRIAGAGI